MEQERYVAKTLQGLEPVLEQELLALGAEEVQAGVRSVSFLGDKRMLYLANYQLRTAIRILKPLFEFEARTPDEIYGASREFDWGQYIDSSKRFAVDSVVYSELFKHSGFVALRLKDAIVDQLRERTGRRPNVDSRNPDILVHMHIGGNKCRIYLDSSGESLHQRGYRVCSDAATLSSVLAAGMILLSGWDRHVPLFDPLCGSGTILIEAALIAQGIAPGMFRARFGFESWPDFDSSLFEEVCNDDSREEANDVLIMGSDISSKAIDASMQNISRASLERSIKLSRSSVFEAQLPSQPGVVITNPPYGERVKQFQLDNFYRQLGDTFKSRYTGWDVWMITGNRLAMKSFGLHASKTMTLFNGPIECKYQRFSIYEGSLRDKGGEELEGM